MKNLNTTAKYEILWQIKEESQYFFIETIQENLKYIEQKIKARLTLQVEEHKVIIFSVVEESTVGSLKLERLLRKQLMQLAKGEERWGAIQSLIALDDNWLVITYYEKEGDKTRLEKLLGSIAETFYYDVYHLYGPDAQQLKQHMLNRQVSLIDWKDKIILVDQEALLKKINLNCEVCTSHSEYGCCCGSPCHYSKGNLKLYKAHEEAILKQLREIEPDFYEAIKIQNQEQWIKGKVELVGDDGEIGECNGRCMLLVREKGTARCIAHHYALEQGIPIYQICPLSCLLFPMEIIEVITDKGKRILCLTSVVEDEIATEIGRWGSYKNLGISLACIDEKQHNIWFKKEDYKPVYKVNEGLLTYKLGEFIYAGIAQSINNV